MKETISELVENIVEENTNWYLDTYSSYTEVGIESEEAVSEFISALESRNTNYHIVGDTTDDETSVIEVYY
jgi:hypothetical protein